MGGLTRLLRGFNIYHDRTIEKLEVKSDEMGTLLEIDNLYRYVDSNIESAAIENMYLTEETGGFDIHFSIKNYAINEEDVTPLNFKIEIPGIRFQTAGKLNILNTQNYMVPLMRDFDVEGDVVSISRNHYGLKDSYYPKAYSPAIVAHDDRFAVGIALHTIFPEDKLPFAMTVKRYTNNNYSFMFETQYPNADVAGNAAYENSTVLQAQGVSREFILSVRFAKVNTEDKKDNWVYTLAPYKEYFNNYFEARGGKHIVHKDTSPILGMAIAFDGYNKGALAKPSIYDQRNYTWYLDFEEEDRYPSQEATNYRNYASKLKTKMDASELKRVMFWQIGGSYCYEEVVEGYDENQSIAYNQQYNSDRNIPAQFMSNIPQKATDILTDIKNTFDHIDYGFWWGRSGQIPYKNGAIIDGAWNPDEIVKFDLNNQQHKNFAENELSLALNHGAKEIGLDAFTNMKLSDQFPWIQRMKQMAGEGVKFWEESVMSDYLHTELSLFLQPNTTNYAHVDDLNRLYTQRPILADYLNPEAEVIIMFKGVNSDGEIRGEVPLGKIKDDGQESYIERLMRLGFTPLLNISNGNLNQIPMLKE